MSARVMRVSDLRSSKKEAQCQWCGRPMDTNTRGRTKKYCSQSCRQRAYEQRNNVSGTSIPADAVIMNPERAAELKDALCELRCAAEDIEVAATEGASAAELSELCQELVRLARSIEHLR